MQRGGRPIEFNLEQQVPHGSHCLRREVAIHTGEKQLHLRPNVLRQRGFSNESSVQYRAMTPLYNLSERKPNKGPRHNRAKVHYGGREFQDPIQNTQVYEARIEAGEGSSERRLLLRESFGDELEKGTPMEVVSRLLNMLSLNSPDPLDFMLRDSCTLPSKSFAGRPSKTPATATETASERVSSERFDSARHFLPSPLPRPYRACFYPRPPANVIRNQGKPQGKTDAPPPRGSLYPDAHVCPLVGLSHFLLSQERDLVSVMAQVQPTSSQEWEKRAQEAREEEAFDKAAQSCANLRAVKDK